MVRYDRNEKIDLELYEHYLRANGCAVLYDRERLNKYFLEQKCKAGVYEEMAKDKMMHHSGCRYVTLSKERIIRYLQECEGCPQHYFNSKKVSGESLDMKHCLTPLSKNGYAQEFLEYYMNNRSLKTKAGNLKKILERCNDGSEVAHDGTKLSHITFNVNQSPNYRYNYSDFDIIAQIPKEATSCIGIEDGYVLAWGDFAQSDFRFAYNLFMRSEQNDKFMMQCDDRYEALARMISASMGQDFDLEKFKEERKLYKVLTLACVYGTENSQVASDEAIVKKINEFLMKCPRYVEYKRRLSAAYRLGLPIEITSYFGNMETSPVYQYSENSTIYRALNAPIQKGTSEVVILTVCKILEKFRELRYSEDDVSLYFTRHDEPIFKIRKEVMKDSWVFKDFETILIGGWTPLNMTFDFGYWYGVRDNALFAEFNESCNLNASKIQRLEPRVEIEDFYPVKNIMELKSFAVPIPELGETVITFLDVERNVSTSIVAETLDEGQIWEVIVDKTRSIDLGDEYSAVNVQNTYQNHDEYFNGNYVRYFIGNNTELNGVAALCRYMVCKYCRSCGIKSPVDPPLKGMEEFVLGVGKMTEIV